MPVRFVVRWLPILIWGVPALVVVAIAEVVTTLTRSDRRSLAGLAGRTVTTTHDTLLENQTSVDQHVAQ